MFDLHELHFTDEASSLLDGVQRRSTPGVNPTLVPLLRGEAMSSAAATQWREDGSALVEAIATGLLISIPIWALIFAIIWSTNALLASG